MAELVWCESEDLLASIYGFKHKAACSYQEESRVRSFVDLVRRFLAATGSSDEVSHIFL